MSKKQIVEVLAALLILLFVYTAISKIMDFKNFKYQLGKSPWGLLAATSTIIAWLLPIAELIIAVLLIIPKTRLIGFYASTIAMVVFTLYIGVLLLSGVDLPCTCGGVISQMPWAWHLFFNLFYLLLCILGIILQKKDINVSNNFRQLREAH